jgi:predicted metal-dependent hydrolase
MEQLEAIIEKLFKKTQFTQPIQEKGLYVFGTFIEPASFDEYRLPFNFLTLPAKEQHTYLKRILLPYIQTQYAYYHAMMKVEKSYKVSIRTMKTRFGSHAKATEKLTFATHLVHYEKSSIDAVIVHELAHHFHFDHSPEFYQCLLHYFPRYKEVHAKLKAHQFHL